MIEIINHKAYSDILKKRNIDKPLLPLVEMELTEQEIKELKRDILELDHADHLETCGREISMCFAYWYRHEYSGGRETKKAEEVAGFIGLDKNKSDIIVDYGLNALKAWGWSVNISKKGYQMKQETLLEQGGYPIKYLLQLVENKEKQNKKERSTNGGNSINRVTEEQEVEQTKVNYLSFLTALLRESPNFSSDWDKALENAQDIVSQIEANDKIPESMKTPYLCRDYLLIIRGIVEENDQLINSLKGTRSLVDKLKEIYYKTNNEVKRLALRWKLRIEHGQILQYYSLINFNLIDPEKLNISTNNCNSFDLILDKRRFRYMRDNVDGRVMYRHRPQIDENTEVYYDGFQSLVQAQIVIGGQIHPFKLMNDAPINFATPQILKESAGYYIQSSYLSGTNNIIIYNDEWHCDSVDTETATYNNENYHLIRFGGEDITLINLSDEEYKISSKNTNYVINITGTVFDNIDCQNFLLTQNGPVINVYDTNGNDVTNECRIVYRVHQSYNTKWLTKKDWVKLPIGFIDVKIELPDNIQKSYTFYEIGNLMPEYVQADGDTTIIKWNTQDIESSSVSIEETYSEYFMIEQQTDIPAQWKLTRKKGVAYRPTCVFHLKANHISPTIDIRAKTLFKANFITETIDGIQRELENGKILSLNKIDDYSILISNDSKKDVNMTISYISKGEVLDTKDFTLQCNNMIYQLSDYKDDIDELIENCSHLYGLITTNRELKIQIGDNRTYYLRQYVYEIEFSGKTAMLKPTPQKPCHLYAIPFIDPEEGCSDDLMKMTSPVELIQEDGKYLMPPTRLHKFLIYSSPKDDERAVPKMWDTTKDLDDQQRKEKKKINIETWVNELKEEACTERNGIWDRCARYFYLAIDESIHFSAFNCMNAVMSNDLLLAKFIVHMILVDDGYRKIIGYLKSLEREFMFSSCWISKDAWKKTIMEFLLKMTGARIEKIEGKSKLINGDPHKIAEYSQKWQPYIHETRRIIFNNAMENGLILFKVLTSNVYTSKSDLRHNDSFLNNIARLPKDTPFRKDIDFILKDDYYRDVNKDWSKQYIMAAMYLAEVLNGMHDDIWKDENYRLRKQILRCQNFRSKIFSELVIVTIQVIVSRKIKK